GVAGATRYPPCARRRNPSAGDSARSECLRPTNGARHVRDTSRPDHDLQRLSLVHGAIAVWNFIEVHRPIEHPARRDAPFHDVRQKLVDVRAHRGRTTGDDHIAVEHRLCAGDDFVVRDTYAPDRTASAYD